MTASMAGRQHDKKEQAEHGSPMPSTTVEGCMPSAVIGQSMQNKPQVVHTKKPNFA
jgi:hypothetical protein